MGDVIREMKTQREYVTGRMNAAIRDGKSISIHFNGDNGKLTIKIGTEIICRYNDIYEALNVLLPNAIKEMA